MIEIPKENNPAQAYQPMPSNLGSFMMRTASTESVDEEPLHTSGEELPHDNPETPGSGIDWPREEEDNPGKKRVSRFSSDAIARIVDRGFANIAAMYTHGDIEDYEADPREMSEVREVLENWMNETGYTMSPTVSMIVSLTGIYMFRIPQLYRDRQRNLKIESNRKAAEEAAHKAKKGDVEDVTDHHEPESDTNKPVQ